MKPDLSTNGGWDRFYFVGERRSARAVRMRVTWEHGRLAACTLFRALVALGLDPLDSTFCNLWYDHGELDPNTLRCLESVSRHGGCPIIALGNKVAAKLTELGIHHLKMVHPAARGKIRLFRRYKKHVAGVLLGDKWLYLER